MIIKILGILDIFVALVFWLFGIFNLGILGGLVFVLGLFLLAKGIAFAVNLNIISILDIVSAGIILLGTLVDFPNILIIIVSLFLLQKGVFSLLG